MKGLGDLWWPNVDPPKIDRPRTPRAEAGSAKFVRVLRRTCRCSRGPGTDRAFSALSAPLLSRMQPETCGAPTLLLSLNKGVQGIRRHGGWTRSMNAQLQECVMLLLHVHPFTCYAKSDAKGTDSQMAKTATVSPKTTDIRLLLSIVPPSGLVFSLCR